MEKSGKGARLNTREPHESTDRLSLSVAIIYSEPFNLTARVFQSFWTLADVWGYLEDKISLKTRQTRKASFRSPASSHMPSSPKEYFPLLIEKHFSLV